MLSFLYGTRLMEDKMLPAEIYKIKDKILDTVKVTKIYLFGSYARGTQTAHSDYDFYVVVPNDSIRPLKVVQKIYCASRH